MNSENSPTLDENLIWLLSPIEPAELRDYSNLKLDCALRATCARSNMKYKAVSMDHIVISIEDGEMQIHLENDQTEKVNYLPLVVVLRTGRGVNADSHITVLRHLEMMGCKIMNSAESTMCCMNKMWTYQELADKGFPMPQTFSYGFKATPTKALDSIEDQLTYPMIVKNVRGSHGRQVILVPDSDLTHDVLPVFQHNTPYVFQEYIKESHGKDVRVIVIGGKVIGAMLRQSTNGRVQSNCGAGGSGTPYDLPPDGATLALEVARCLKLDYCGIDLLLGKQGFIICEVNSNAQFEKFDSIMGANVAELISEMAVAEVIRRREMDKNGTGHVDFDSTAQLNSTQLTDV